MKSVIKLLVSLSICFFLIAICPAAMVSADDEYQLWIGGVQVNEYNRKMQESTHWSYDPDTNTLTLDNFEYSGVGYNFSGEYHSCIYYNGRDDLTISLKGKNVITQTKKIAYNNDNVLMSARNDVSITITGTGSLNATIQDSWGGAAIRCNGKLIVSSGSLKATGGYDAIYADEVIIKKGVTDFDARCYRSSTNVISGTVINEVEGFGYDTNDQPEAIAVSTTGKKLRFKSVAFPVATLTIVFDPDEGNGSMDSIQITENERVTIPECEFEPPEGKLFDHWLIKDTTQIATPGREAAISRLIANDGVITLKAIYYSAPAAVVKTAPEAIDRTYDGSAKELIKAGGAEDGEMRYALGTNDEEPPVSDWSTDIPTATDAGTYYVWYMAAGDSKHSNSQKTCVTVTIAKKDVTVKAMDQTIKETESPDHDSSNVVLDGGLSGHKITSVTISSKDGKLIPSDAVIMDTRSKAVTHNYNITYEEGILTVLQKISYMVTFKVENGEWDNGGSDAIEVPLDGFEGDELKLQPDQIPGAGTKPAANYKQGAWKVTPDTETVITKDTDFVYTYAEDPVYTVTVQGDNYTPGSGKNIVFTVKRNLADDTTYSRFESFTVDGNAVSDKYFEKVPGSLILTVKSEFLDTLSEGSHSIKVLFNDGEAEVAINILKAPVSAGGTSGAGSIPKTGESGSSLIWIVLLLAGATGLLIAVLTSKNSRRKVRPAPHIPGRITGEDK